MDVAADTVKAWARIETWLQQNAPRIHAELKPPASEQAIVETESVIGVRLPDDVRALYRIHDGQGREGGGLLGGWTWLDLNNVVGEWRVWKKLRDAKQLGDDTGYVADPGVRAESWNVKWIPITYSGAGDHHCVDLAPAPGGASGQIIKMWHDLEGRSLVATNLHAWLEILAGELESGERFYDEEYGALLRAEDI